MTAAVWWRGTFAAGVLLSGIVVSQAGAWDNSPLTKPVVLHSYHCGARDLPEHGIQGDVPKADQKDGRAKDGYNCGLERVGFTPLAKTADGRDSRPNANANMAWAGRCAYVSGSASSLFNPPVVTKAPTAQTTGAGIAVVDVHHPAHPKMVKILRMPGGVATSETINAITRPNGMGVLVVGEYGNDPKSYDKPMDIYTYDTRDPDCANLRHVPNPYHPKTRATYYWPQNIHNLTVTPDGKYVYATILVAAVDLRDMWRHLHSPAAASYIKYVGNLNDNIGGAPVGVGPVNDVIPPEADPVGPQFVTDNSHEAWATNDKTVYIGGQQASGDMFTIIRDGAWLASDGKKPAKIVSQWAGRGHSIRTATIGGQHYVLHSEESPFGTGYSCVPQEANPFAGPSQPFLTNIDDPTRPKTVAEMGLQINEVKNCPTQLADGIDASVHYHDVDNAKHTHFVLASMWNAGIRIFDVRDPAKPTEVAYFNPGDVAGPGQAPLLDHVWGHIHYDAKRGEIWFASASGGFFVVRIEDQVRRQLQLPAVASSAPRTDLRHGIDVGAPGTVGVRYPRYSLADIAT
ncbi:MAG: hypothetical protein JO246_04695, partial [Frankiaceae bacterium]|nr:hypothetical protein [Frankiaceae bacterium]